MNDGALTVLFFCNDYQRYYITITHMLLNLNRSSHVKARNVVILPCVQDDDLTSDLYVTRVTFHCLFKQRHLSA